MVGEKNSKYTSLTGHINLGYQVSKKIHIAAEYTKMDFASQQAGGLTDAQFKENHRKSSRARNWMGAPWNVGSVTIKYDVTSNFNIQLKTFITASERNSVGYLKSINFKDSINPATNQYSTRQVDRDYYQNYGAELRFLLKYNVFKKQHILASGVRSYYGTIKRNQLGVGSTGSDFDLNLTNPQYGRALEFSTTNYAAFIENIFYIGNRIKIIPGIRLEDIGNSVKGYINTSSTGQTNPTKTIRNVLLYGIGSEFAITKKTNLYFNYSLGYRPVTFSELTPSSTTEVIDPNLKDASGYNMDLGYKGSLKNIVNFDISAYYLLYNNRVGSITQNGNLFRTNIGTSVSKGIESFIEINPLNLFTNNIKLGELNIFASNALVDAVYTKWNNPAIASDPTKAIENKRVENAPQYIHRYGLSYTIKGFFLSVQYSNVGEVYTDAANTELANATATTGKIAAYKVMDATIGYKFLNHYSLKIGVNNLTDEKYATRRSGGYPGPGLLPANARSFYATFGIKF
jgi:Fe(3+) dicitrate transport protein